MGQTQPPKPVKLIVAMLGQREADFDLAQNQMQKLWGAIDLQSDLLSFEHSSYYEKEMGSRLLRKLVSFTELIDPGSLAAIKHQSNQLEIQFANTARDQSSDPDSELSPVLTRNVNLDPGYVEPGKLVLATTKNYSHRLYIGQSMYAEATLHYYKGQWQPWPYTYPDYAGGDYFPFLNQVRQRLLEQLQQLVP